MTFRTRDGHEWEPPPRLIAELEYAYSPAVDIETALRQARAWVEANPSRRKTRRGMPRFLNGWVARDYARAAEQRRRGDTAKQRLRRECDIPERDPRYADPPQCPDCHQLHDPARGCPAWAT